MTELEVANYIEKSKDYLFPNDKIGIGEIEAALLDCPSEATQKIGNLKLMNPSLIMGLAFFPGVLGVDRFVLGDIVMGVLKYFTFGGFGIWWIVDIFNAKSRCRTRNCNKLLSTINSAKKQKQNPVPPRPQSANVAIPQVEDSFVPSDLPYATTMNPEPSCNVPKEPPVPPIDKNRIPSPEEFRSQ